MFDAPLNSSMEWTYGEDRQYCHVVSESDVPALEDAVNTNPFQSLVKNPRPHSDFEYLPDTVLYLPAVITSCKPGATTSIRTSEIPKVENHSSKLSSLGMHHKISVDHDAEHTVFRFTADEELLSGIDYREEDRAFGRFLGVPEEDNKWYDEDDMPSIDEATPILEFLGVEEPDGLKYARLVSWICRPTMNGLNRTISTGLEYYNLAVELQEKYGYDNPLNWCEDEFERLDGYWY